MSKQQGFTKWIVRFTVVLLGVVGLASGQVTLSISEPANGTHLVVGEEALVTVTLPDGLTTDDFSTLSLYMYGPQETPKTKTAVKLLNASTDRAVRPHHYIDLIADASVQVNDNVLTYALQAVSDEEAGTYTATLRVVMKEDSTIRSFELADFQLGTATVEEQIVEKENCAACHLGADNGQFYLHHVDPRTVGQYGSPEIDSWPVRTCKSCHNTDGYAAYRDPDDTDVRIPDPIVHRVHGVHNGSNLENPRNNDPDTGLFSDYLHVTFPADVKNCTKCHADHRWMTKPSRLACGACHDNIWFGALADMPLTGEAHPGGPKNTDTTCRSCHPATGGWVEGEAPAPISTVHKIDLSTEFTVELDMTAPANGTHYVAGETPQIVLVLKDAITGIAVDPTTIAQADWNRFRLHVSGPREHTEPVLTAAAADPSLSGSTSYIYNDLRVQTDPATENPGISRTAADITYQLADVAGLEAGTYTVFVQARFKNNPASVGVINFQVGTETEEQMVATNCMDCHGDTKQHGSYPFNPDVCKNCHDYQNQLAGKTGWGDSNWGFGAAPLARRIHGVHRGHYLNKPEDIHGEGDAEHFGGIIFPQDIRNCTKCHADNPMFMNEPSRLACLACHDSDGAIFHGNLMTFDPTPEDPFSDDAVETCIICHSADSYFSPASLHNVYDPYRPPYPREAAE